MEASSGRRSVLAENRNRALILIVDDDPALSEMLQIVLRQEGFDTTHCATGTGARWEERGTTSA